MKKLFYGSAALLSLMLFACGGGTTSPRVFNDTAMNAFKNATETLDRYDVDIVKSVEDGDLSGVNQAADKALTEVDTQIEKVEALNNPAGDDYKAAVLVALERVKEIIEVGRKYADLPEGYTNSAFNAINKQYNDKRNELSSDLQKVATAQAAFVKNVSAN